MDGFDVEIEEYEEIIGDLVWHEDQRVTEEARAVSIQEPPIWSKKSDDTHRATGPETSIQEPSRYYTSGGRNTIIIHMTISYRWYHTSNMQIIKFDT